ncbi:MAG TPA: nuclear transport factor 2 family protein [Puia sp.]|nr:nuclear transport factor 2 family protein [Puia sp.]
MEAIESLFETYKKSVFQKDVETFVSIFDENVRVFDMWQRWSYDGLSDWREMVENWFGSLGENKDIVEFDDIQIQSTDEMAFASAFVKFTAVSEKGEELRYLENRLTWVIQKRGNSWNIIHQHTSGPIDFQTMKVILQRSFL